MDDDALRRGKPTNHIVYGVGMATLAGDGLQTQAFENITGYWLAQNKPEIGLRAAHELAIGAGNQGMVVGQAQDLLAEGKHIDEANMKYIHAHKTGALITASVRIGAIIGGANEEQLARSADTASTSVWRSRLPTTSSTSSATKPSSASLSAAMRRTKKPPTQRSTASTLPAPWLRSSAALLRNV